MAVRHRSAPRWWHKRGLVPLLLLPLTAIFLCAVVLRRHAYRLGLLRVSTVRVPVVVVGNVAVGGSGKTPAVIWLIESLRARGWRPGVVSRGYGGTVIGTAAVRPDSDPSQVGDEPVLIARRTGAPVQVAKDRVAAAHALLAAHPDVDVLIADDGLQHYRLGRACEIVVLDPQALGNGLLLPAGPLREPLRRVVDAHVVLLHAADAGAPDPLQGTPAFRMQLHPGAFYRLGEPSQRCEPNALKGLRLRALAGIGRPQRFFETLSALGLTLSRADAYPDHHAFSAADLALDDCDALLITEKDAIKCAGLAPRETWVLPVEARIADAALSRIEEVLHGRKTA